MLGEGRREERKGGREGREGKKRRDISIRPQKEVVLADKKKNIASHQNMYVFQMTGCGKDNSMGVRGYRGHG